MTVKLSEFRQNIELSNSFYDDTQTSGKKIKDLERILEVVKRINGSLIVEDVLEQVLFEAIKLTESERGFIVLQNNAGQLEYRLGLDQKGEKLPEHFFNISTTVIEDVFQTGQSKFIEGAQTDTDNNRSKSILRLALQTILCSPLIVDGKKIGVIYVDSKFLHKIKNRQTTYTFEILAGQAAIAINNAQVYEQLEIAKEKSEASNRLKTDFLAQISHEIRTPINAMLSFSSYLKDELEESITDDVAVGFDMIESGGRRLIRTIDLILNMSEVQAGTYEPSFKNIELESHLLKPIISEYRNLAEGRKLKLYYTSGLEPKQTINCDRHTVAQILIQLLDNAVKYTEIGHLEVIVDKDENDQIFIEIKDTGIGISEKYLTKLFTPFSQEDTGYTRKYEGTGLGLALVKKYADINGAEIVVESEKGCGSSFRLIFPRKY